MSSSFQGLENAFRENFALGREKGASVCLYQRGKLLLSLAAGETGRSDHSPWSERTLIPVFSATKAASSSCVLLALAQKGLNPECPLGDIWPHFPLAQASVAQLLSHQCGFTALQRPIPFSNHEEIIAEVEKMTPLWSPPLHGYHPRMFGPLVEELMRRLTGQSLPTYWEEQVRAPLKLDFYLGLPESEFSRVGRLFTAKARPEQLKTPFYKEYFKTGSLVQRAFSSPFGYQSVQEMNSPEAWQAGLPALGGVASAQGLAAFYQATLGFSLTETPSPFNPQIQAWMQTPQSQGEDQLLGIKTAFSCGFMQDPLNPQTGQKERFLFGPHSTAYGHPGAGGSIGLADPETGLSFAYTPNQMELGILPEQKTRHLLQALLSSF